MLCPICIYSEDLAASTLAHGPQRSCVQKDWRGLISLNVAWVVIKPFGKRTAAEDCPETLKNYQKYWRYEKEMMLSHCKEYFSSVSALREHFEIICHNISVPISNSSLISFLL